MQINGVPIPVISIAVIGVVKVTGYKMASVHIHSILQCCAEETINQKNAEASLPKLAMK